MSDRGQSRTVKLGFALVLATATALGLSFGVWVVNLDETKIITRAAALYVEAGGNAEDCVARPGQSPVWIVVTCGAGEESLTQAYNRLGFRVTVAPPKSGI